MLSIAKESNSQKQNRTLIQAILVVIQRRTAPVTIVIGMKALYLLDGKKIPVGSWLG